MTKLTLEIDGTICSMEIPYNDVSATELIKGFGSNDWSDISCLHC